MAEEIKCPKCGEINFKGALACWKCNTPLGEVALKRTFKPPEQEQPKVTTPRPPLCVGGTIVVVLILAVLVGSVARIIKYTTGPYRTPAHSASEKKKLKMEWEITSLETTWSLSSVSRVWTPEIRITVKNTGSCNIDALYFEARFFDAEGTITYDDREIVESIPPGSSKGPIFLTCGVGYTSDYAFIPMIQNDSKKWHFDLLEGDSYGGPWKKIKSGSIEVPEAYKKIMRMR